MVDIGTPGSATYAVALSDIGSMLNVLPDNTANQIMAQDVRNVVFTLYEDITGLSQSIQQSITAGSSSNVYYSNPNPSSITVGGILVGSTFNNLSVQQMFDNMFYPYVGPVSSISPNITTIEYGNSTQIINLNWSISAKKNVVISASITIPGSSTVTLSTTPIAANTTSFSSVSNVSPVLNTNTTFTLNVNDYNSSNSTGGTKTATANVTWSNRRYWGTLPTSSPLVSVSSATFSHSMISSLSSELNNGYAQTRTITRTTSDYVVFIWPTNVVNLSATPPVATIGGFGVNAFTKTRSNVAFTNQWGYVTYYDVWRLDTQANDSLRYILT